MTPPSEDELHFTHSGREYLLGRGRDFYAVWDRRKRGPPVARFPRTEDGWQNAWLHYSTLETEAAKPAKPKGRSSQAGLVVIVLLLVTLLFAAAFANPRLNIPLVSKFTCSIKGGTWTEGSVVWGVPVGCYDASTA